MLGAQSTLALALSYLRVDFGLVVSKTDGNTVASLGHFEANSSSEKLVRFTLRLVEIVAVCRAVCTDKPVFDYDQQNVTYKQTATEIPLVIHM